MRITGAYPAVKDDISVICHISWLHIFAYNRSNSFVCKKAAGIKFKPPNTKLDRFIFISIRIGFFSIVSGLNDHPSYKSTCILFKVRLANLLPSHYNFYFENALQTPITYDTLQSILVRYIWMHCKVSIRALHINCNAKLPLWSQNNRRKADYCFLRIY